MKFLDLFAGVGGFRQGMESTGNTCAGYVEIDKFARQSYEAIYNTEGEWTANDIKKVTDEEWKQFSGKVECICGGFPCTPAGSKVLTQSGYKNIEDVVIGDKVLTHKNRFQSVIKVMSKIAYDYNLIKAKGVYSLQLTDNHPVYVYDVKQKLFEWVPCASLKKDRHMLTININKKEVITGLTDNQLWLLGRYIADGYIEQHTSKDNKHRYLTFAIGKPKLEEFLSHLKGLDYYLSHQDRGAVEVTIKCQKLLSLCKDAKIGAKNKVVPAYLFDAPVDEIKKFLRGYLAGDGCEDRGRTMWTTVSEELALGLQQLYIKAYGMLPAIYVRKDKRKETFNDTYNSQVHASSQGSKVINGYMVTPIRSIIKHEKRIRVYNLEVENDNSYTINNTIVHNCQSFSISGKRAGFADKTRGTLFFEIARAAKQIKPRYLFLENVKGLLSHDKGRTFETILQTLDELGYDAEWQVCNSKDFGVPQNRERVIIIGHLRGKSTREVFFDAGKGEQVTNKNEIVDLLPVEDSRHGRRGTVLSPNGISSALAATDYKLPKQIIQVGNYMDDHNFKNPQPGRVYSAEGISPTLNTMTGGSREPKIVVKEEEDIMPINAPDTLNKSQNGRRIKDAGDPEFTLTVRDRHGIVIKSKQGIRIRKLTPLECWRLQGFPDSSFYKAKNSGISDSQLYKQAGNSVTVPLMKFVAERLSEDNTHMW